jgi:hypothetical protein
MHADRPAVSDMTVLILVESMRRKLVYIDVYIPSASAFWTP